MNQIRKISVGPNYPDKCLHYLVGQHKTFKSGNYKISEIVKDFRDGVLFYDIYLLGDLGKVLWKSVTGVPVALEYNIDFE